MNTHFLLPKPSQLSLDGIDIQDQTIYMAVHSTSTSATCPDCQQCSDRIHSYYTRQPADLPCGGFVVRMTLEVHRYFCDNILCKRRTFTERLPDVVLPNARRTNRLASAQRAIAFSDGGEAGARLSQRLGMPTSPDTLLRIIRRTPEPDAITPKVLGVDDWAIRKGRRYGTILVNLETRRPIDLLSERSTKAFAEWLKAHPGVQIISRDRSNAYAKGAAEGAPEAIQVADRWHLVKNLRETLETYLDQNRACLLAAADVHAETEKKVELSLTGDLALHNVEKPSASSGHAVKITRAEQERLRRREKRLKRYGQVIELHQQGVGIREIARRMHIGRDTVRRYLRTGEFPEMAQRQKMLTKISPYTGYLKKRWEEGCQNKLQLWREIRDQGFDGSHLLVYIWAKQHEMVKTPKVRTPGKRKEKKPNKVYPWAASRAVWLLMKGEQELKPEERQALKRMKQSKPEINLVLELAHEFRSMVRKRESEKLLPWMKRAEESGIDALRSFVQGLREDQFAVEAGLSKPWSNGITEGHVNRLKMLKRQMYGRANFDLLRKRVLDLPLA